MKSFCRSIDFLNEWVGKISGWLIIPLTLLVIYDVTLRYVFNRPTVWAWDINIQLLGALVVLGGGYTLLHGGHIGVDVLVVQLSSRRRAMVDLITSLFFFFSIGVLLWKAVGEASFSVQIRELYTSVFAPPIYPFKILMVVGILLLLLQGMVKFIRDLITVASTEMKGRS
ncbi:MAG: TRAP transporter small permease subunit [Deltaproteobacteria bacterium]|nr:TRAP transporter small permease subunit [Deltaproteobacteria bacterium]